MHALIHYFVTYFKLQNLQLKRDSLGDDGQTLIDNCKKDVDDKFFRLSSIYAQIILTQSGEVTHIQQDRMFWETLYDASDQVLQEVFVGQKKTNVIEIELKRDPTNYSVRELYALKNEGDPMLNSRTLASIYTKVKSNSVQCAAISRSPLIEHLNIGSKAKVSKPGSKEGAKDGTK